MPTTEHPPASSMLVRRIFHPNKRHLAWWRLPTCLEYVNRNTLPTTAIEVDNNVNNSNALSLLVVIYPNLLKSINYNGDYDYLNKPISISSFFRQKRITMNKP